MSIISAGTSNTTSLVYTGDTTGQMVFQTNGTTEAMRIDASQRVLIGATSPTVSGSNMQINCNSGGGVGGANPNPSVFMNYIGVGGSGQFNTLGLHYNFSTVGNGPGLSFSSLDAAGTRYTTALLGTAITTNTAGSISADLLFNTVNSASLNECLRINSNGNLILQGGTTTASGIGITFPASQYASSNPNTLDDYEEGTWTPTASSTGGSLSSYTSQGTYTKVGRLVQFTYRVITTSVGTASGNLVVGNFPFTCGTTNIQSTYIVREGALTGQCYQYYLNSGGTDGILQTLTGSALTWTNNYSYYVTGCYISAT